MPVALSPVTDVVSQNNFQAVASELKRLRETNASKIAPTKPLAGQLWYDSQNNLLKYYNTSFTAKTVVSSPVAVTDGGTGLTTLSQGDVLYASAANTLSALAKNTTATRYFANTGTSNNPAWAQVDLSNGVTGGLAVGNGGTGQTTFTKGDILVAANSSTLNKQAVGSDGLVLQADSSQTNGVKYNGVGFIGYATDSGDRSTTATTDGTATAIANLSITFTVQSGAIYRISVGQSGYNSGANTNYVQIWQGTVGSGTKKAENLIYVPAGRVYHGCTYVGTLTAGSQTINVGIKVSAGTGHLDGAASTSFLIIERLS